MHRGTWDGYRVAVRRMRRGQEEEEGLGGGRVGGGVDGKVRGPGLGNKATAVHVFEVGRLFCLFLSLRFP